METDRLTLLTVAFILGIAMVVTGITYFVLFYLRHWRRRKERNRAEGGKAIGAFMVGNVFFHFGMFMVTLGGIGLIYYGYYR
jgi:heme/copper-type cytochrome/quinol oxidase subunit 2